MRRGNRVPLLDHRRSQGLPLSRTAKRLGNLPVLAAWRHERHGRALGFGRPAELDLREIMNAICYVDRTGVEWRFLPHDFSLELRIRLLRQEAEGRRLRPAQPPVKGVGP